MIKIQKLLVYAFFIAPIYGCSSVYFATLEKIGVEKRDLMVSRIEDARDSQLEAKEQFKNALEQYRSVVTFNGGSLEEKYDKLNAVLEDSESKASEVKDRVIKVREVAVALFREWKDELNEYSDQRLRRDSEKKLENSKAEYSRMMASMKIASDKLDPALQPLKDSVLYLKHNLNAQAIAALDKEMGAIEERVEELINELSRAIDDANAYIITIENH